MLRHGRARQQPAHLRVSCVLLPRGRSFKYPQHWATSTLALLERDLSGCLPGLARCRCMNWLVQPAITLSWMWSNLQICCNTEPRDSSTPGSWTWLISLRPVYFCIYFVCMQKKNSAAKFAYCQLPNFAAAIRFPDIVNPQFCPLADSKSK